MPRWALLLLLPLIANSASGQTPAPTTFTWPNFFSRGLVPPPGTGAASAAPSLAGPPPVGFNPYPTNNSFAAPSSVPVTGFGAAPAVRPAPVWNDPSTWGFNFPTATSSPYPPAANTAPVAFGATPPYQPPTPTWNNSVTAPPNSFGAAPVGTNPYGGSNYGTNTWNNTGFGGANSGWPANTTNNPLSSMGDQLRQWLNPLSGSATGPTSTWSQQPPNWNGTQFGRAPLGSQPQPQSNTGNAFNAPGAVASGQPTWNAPQPTSLRTTNPVVTGGVEPAIVIPPAALAGEIYAPTRRVREQPRPAVTQPQPTGLQPAPPPAYPQQPPPGYSQQPPVRPQRNWLEMTDLPPVQR